MIKENTLIVKVSKKCDVDCYVAFVFKEREEKYMSTGTAVERDKNILAESERTENQNIIDGRLQLLAAVREDMWPQLDAHSTGLRLF